MLARRGGGLARRGVTRGSASSPASERRDDDSNIPSRDARASTRASRAFSASARVRDAGVSFIIEPHLRFVGMPGEQWTMFFKDPSGNNLEFKSMAKPNLLFAKYNVAEG